MPSYAEAKGIVKKEPRSERELIYRIKELEKEVKKKEKEIAEEKEKVEILKNPCTSICNHTNEMRSDLRAQLRTFGEEDVQGIGTERSRILPKWNQIAWYE